MPWKPAATQMSAEGRCFVSCLASVKNSSLAFGDGTLRPVGGGSGHDVYLPEEIRVFVCGTWVTDFRDADVLCTPCTVCKKKMQDDGTCHKELCTGVASTTKSVLTTVSLSDATRTLQHVLVRVAELLAFVGLSSVDDLAHAVEVEGHVSLPFRRRADVIPGAHNEPPSMTTSPWPTSSSCVSLAGGRDMGGRGGMGEEAAG